jgi:hypothetical protein
MSLLLYLCLLFNKIRDKDRTGSAWKWVGEGGKRVGAGDRVEK